MSAVTASSLLSVLTTALLPVLAIAAAGYALARYRDVDVEPLSAISLYVLMPALVFHSLVTTPLEGRAVLALAGAVVAFTVAMTGVGYAFARASGRSGPLSSALVLVAAFPNAGNLGIPVSDFAFGAVGRSTAVLFVTVQVVLMYTLGVVVAAGGGDADLRGSVSRVFSLPLVYAVAAAGVVQVLGVELPADSTTMQTLKLTGDAAIPVMLVLLGVQLANTTHGAALGRVWSAVGLKLLVAPVVGLAVALVVIPDASVARVFVVECAMPAAVTPLLLAVEFEPGTADLSPSEYVSTAIMVTTLGCLVTLVPLIALLQAGLGF